MGLFPLWSLQCEMQRSWNIQAGSTQLNKYYPRKKEEEDLGVVVGNVSGVPISYLSNTISLNS